MGSVREQLRDSARMIPSQSPRNYDNGTVIILHTHSDLRSDCYMLGLSSKASVLLVNTIIPSSAGLAARKGHLSM